MMLVIPMHLRCVSSILSLFFYHPDSNALAVQQLVIKWFLYACRLHAFLFAKAHLAVLSEYDILR